MTVKGGSRPACAACRFQRRRCSSDCPLAPYFPAIQPKIFQNVHRLYGVGNIMKILNQLKDDEQKEEAMKSIKYESYIRQIYRVHGCYGLIVQLHQKLVESMQELQYVRILLDACKKNSKRTQDSLNDIKDQVLGGSNDWITAMINGGSDLGFYDNGSSDQIASYDWDDQTKTSIDFTRNQSRFDEFQQLCSVEQGEGIPDYTAITCGSFVDDQHSFMGSKEAYYLNWESSLKETKHFIEPGDTKTNEKLFQVQQGVRRLTMGF